MKKTAPREGEPLNDIGAKPEDQECKVKTRSG
jgi:hypothetical protein